MFEIKQSLQLTVSLLTNDVRNFAILYKTFRDTHFEFFDLDDELCGSDPLDQNNSCVDKVPVDAHLSKCFYILELIDEFRFSGNSQLLD